jgi:hypothetical protein
MRGRCGRSNLDGPRSAFLAPAVGASSFTLKRSSTSSASGSSADSCRGVAGSPVTDKGKPNPAPGAVTARRGPRSSPPQAAVGLRPPFNTPAVAFSSCLSRRSHLDCRAAPLRGHLLRRADQGGQRIPAGVSQRGPHPARGAVADRANRPIL